MRTYDIETLLKYCNECADNCAYYNDPLSTDIPCVQAIMDTDCVNRFEFDFDGECFFTLVNNYAKSHITDVCIKSIQVNESSQLTAADVNEMLKVFNKGWRERYPEGKNQEPFSLHDCVLLEISYTTTIDNKRYTETVFASNDWFDNISDFCDSWDDECLQ